MVTTLHLVSFLFLIIVKRFFFTISPFTYRNRSLWPGRHRYLHNKSCAVSVCKRSLAVLKASHIFKAGSKGMQRFLVPFSFLSFVSLLSLEFLGLRLERLQEGLIDFNANLQSKVQ